MMREVKFNRHKGFTLVELVMTLILISLLSSVAAVVVLGPFQTFYVMRDNIKLFSQFEQASDDLEYYFLQAAPASIKISDNNQSLSFRTIVQQGWIRSDVFFETGAMPLESADLQMKGVIFFPDYPKVGMQKIDKKQSQLSFVNKSTKQRLKGRQYLRYQLLSEPIYYQFKPKSSQLLRIAQKANENTSYQALVGHLSDCEFFWFSDKKRLDIKMSLKNNHQQEYHFRQQIALY